MYYVKREKAAEPISTIVVTVESSRDFAWSPALGMISQMLHSERLSHLGVLLLGPDAEKGPRKIEFSYQHHVVRTWPGLSHRVADVLEGMDLCFLDLNVYNWGITKEAARMTVMLILDLDDVLRTGEMKISRRRIKDVCIELDANYLDVLIDYGLLQTTARNSKGTVLSHHQPFEEKVPMGHSIGTNATDSGTLGGYLSLTNPKGPRKVVLLTSRNTIRPITTSMQQNHSKIISSPSNADLKHGIAYYHDSVTTIQNLHRYISLQKVFEAGTASVDDLD